LSDKKPSKNLRQETQQQTNARIEKAIEDVEGGKVPGIHFQQKSLKVFQIHL
jgi:hypothetical protein